LAVGFAASRAVVIATAPRMRVDWSKAPLYLQLSTLIEPALAAITMVEGVILLVERLRRKGPAVWGLGRWTWSVAALYIPLYLGFQTLVAIVQGGRRGARLPASRDLANIAMRSADLFRSRFVWALVAGWIAIKLSRWPIGSEADAREWSGRLFATLLVVWALGLGVLLPFLR
jgi:hypothetical protein